MHRIGLVADTHGFLGDDALAALRGSDLIVHAGDIGDGVLTSLRTIAEVVAVRGNNDSCGEAAQLPELAEVQVAGHRITVVHRLADAPAPDTFDILVFGHCHRQHTDKDGPRLLVNPGAAGRRGLHATRSVALLTLRSNIAPTVQFIDLGPRSGKAR